MFPLVSCSRLAEQLQEGMEDTLTLVSAPAGFGKTTVLAQWLNQNGIDSRLWSTVQTTTSAWAIYFMNGNTYTWRSIGQDIPYHERNMT